MYVALSLFCAGLYFFSFSGVIVTQRCSTASAPVPRSRCFLGHFTSCQPVFAVLIFCFSDCICLLLASLCLLLSPPPSAPLLPALAVPHYGLFPRSPLHLHGLLPFRRFTVGAACSPFPSLTSHFYIAWFVPFYLPEGTFRQLLLFPPRSSCCNRSGSASVPTICPFNITCSFSLVLPEHSLISYLAHAGALNADPTVFFLPLRELSTVGLSAFHSLLRS